MIELQIAPHTVASLRLVASEIVDDTMRYIRANTTTGVERAIVRLMGLGGVCASGAPRPNVLVDHLGKELGRGAAFFLANGVARTGLHPDALCDAIERGELDLRSMPVSSPQKVFAVAEQLTQASLERIRANRAHRESRLAPKAVSPIFYVIVATGNIYEDAEQAANAARSGADIISIIRSTAQSLLDYVPYGITTEGFGGSYATQENFQVVRAALDTVSDELGRYVRLANYASGLCMPEIAAMAALERLDVLINDCMYGILFRDINMRRTLIDQHFSRMLNALAGMMIHTGEDNILRMSDAAEKMHTVLASNFMNEQFARRAGLPEELIGLGHSFEVDPDREDSVLYEIGNILLVSSLFPRSPVKYMPPTRYMTGDIFKTFAINTLYNMVSMMAGPRIHFPGMLTEGIQTPYMHDRHLALENCAYVMNATRHLRSQFTLRSDSFIARYTDGVLGAAQVFLGEVKQLGLMGALEAGMFAETKRRPDGGKGGDGVFPKTEDYFNPLQRTLTETLGT